MPQTLLEICVDSPADVRRAVAERADRIELCSALALGGLTPDPALATIALEAGARVHAMIRPRAGDFRYDMEEVALMHAQIAQLGERGVHGFVLGATDANGDLDRDVLARLRQAAGERACVLHRAIDLTRDPVAATCEALELGFDAILTSGGARDAAAGTPVIARMVAAAAGRGAIMAGGGITPENAAELVRATGVAAIHSSASVASDWSDPRIAAYGFAAGPRKCVETERVRRLRAALAASG